ncbi:hypothetical protein SELMODRAFT_76951 [Selaginella moellendorffii]|uniref:Pectinesterase n=2 Tax=Selaginella moellendorffii TaxID=88036 RepID=D8QSQ0_SELML|nr:hypothetical protein SELMODRAFT_76951 [Selaginella moellendorffii]
MSAKFNVLVVLLLGSFLVPSEAQVLATDSSPALQRMEKDFVSWVNWIGSLKHSMFGKTARNRIKVARTIVVSKTIGEGDYTTVQAALNSIPDYNGERIVIHINPGYYREKVTVPITKPYITLQGSGAWLTIIDWNDTASSPGPGGQPLGTFESATVGIYASFFIAKNITFKNSAVFFPGAPGKQAVALRISGDTAAFYGCHFLGSQDTLYDHSGRHYFRECYIEGSIDFIFGDGHSYYYKSHLHAAAENCGGIGALAAQKRTNQSERTGFSFVNCRVTGSGTIFLGRAWGDFSRVVYAFTYMDNIVVPEGWDNWGDPNKEHTVFFGQYKCSGPGANHAGRVAWSHELTPGQAQPFLDPSFIDGSQWLPT